MPGQSNQPRHPHKVPPVPQLQINHPQAYDNLLQVRVGGNHIWAIVDSGATISVISRETAALLDKCIISRHAPEFSHVSGVGGDMLEVREKVLIEMYISNRKFEFFFHVIPGTNAMILGMDFMSEFGVKIDFKSSTLSVDNLKLVVGLCSQAVKSCLARTVIDYYFPPKTETLCQLYALESI